MKALFFALAILLALGGAFVASSLMAPTAVADNVD